MESCQGFASRFLVVGISHTDPDMIEAQLMIAVSVADLLACIVSLTIILLLWLQ